MSYSSYNRSLINKLRYKYSSMEEAYLKENNINIPKCKYCESNAKFKGFFIGYKEICSNEKCQKIFLIECARKRNKLKKEKNDEKIIKCKICSNNIKIKDLKNRKSKICNDDFCQRHKKYPFKNEHIIDNFKPYDYSYLNLISYELLNKYNDVKKVKHILYKNFISHKVKNPINMFNDFRLNYLYNKKKIDLKDYYLSEDTCFYIKKNLKNKRFFYKKLYKDKFLDFIKTYYPENFKICKICGKQYEYKELFGKIKSQYTCSLKCYYKNFKFYVTDERKKKQSIALKKAIAENRFKPNINNYWTKLDIYLKHNNIEYKFRSSWELCFFILNENYDLKYEDLRITYTYNNIEKIYIVDFIDYKNKVVYEIKPSIYMNKDINILKEESLIYWCNLNFFIYKRIDESFFKKYTYIDFNTIVKKNNFKIPEKVNNKIKHYLINENI